MAGTERRDATSAMLTVLIWSIGSNSMHHEDRCQQSPSVRDPEPGHPPINSCPAYAQLGRGSGYGDAGAGEAADDFITLHGLDPDQVLAGTAHDRGR